MREPIAINSNNNSSRFPAKTAETLAANRTITQAEADRYQSFAFDPGGSARDLTLPAEGNNAGAMIFVANTADGAEIITVKNDNGDAICTPTQNEAALLWCDGVAWYGLVGDFA